MTAWSRWGALCIAAIACEPAPPPAAADAGMTSSTGTSATVSALPETAVVYDCAGFPRQIALACDPPPEWLTTLERFGVYVTDPGMTRATAGQCVAAKDALAEALAAPLGAIGTAARI